MGDIADMTLEGLLDEETGEYIGDINAAIYGAEAPGFPISYKREHREAQQNKVSCPACGKRVKGGGFGSAQAGQTYDQIGENKVSDFSERIGFNIKMYRNKAGLTQEELAGILKVSRTAVTNWERGTAQPKLESLVKMEKILNTPMRDLLNLDIERCATCGSVLHKKACQTGGMTGFVSMTMM